MAQRYEVRGPDGAIYDIDAPDDATEDEVLARVQQQAAPKRLSAVDEAAYAALAADPRTTAADLKGFAGSHGITIRDSDVAAFLAARDKGSRVSKRVVYENLPKAPRAGLAQNAGAFLGRMVDGALPGAARTDRGFARVFDNATASLTGREAFEPGKAFQQGRDEMDYAQARLDAEHPNLAVAADVAGLAGSFALPEARILRGAGLGAATGNAALTGAMYGALSGAMNETGDGELTNAGLGAAAGGLFGSFAPAALRAGSGVAQSVRRNVPGVDPTARFLANVPRRAMGLPQAPPGLAAAAQAERNVNRQLRDATIRSGMGTGNVPATPASIEAEVLRRQSLGVPAVPADVSEGTQRVTSRALSGGGPATTRARSMLSARQAEQASRVRSHITAELGPAVDPISAIDDINRRASEEAAPLYEQAYAQPMLVTPEVERIMRTPAFRAAVPQAFENIENAMGDPRGMGFRILPETPGALPPELQHFRAADGRLVAVDPDSLTFEAFDQVSRAMRDSGEAAMNTNGFRPRNTTNSVHINARAGDLRAALREQNGPYREVTDLYADEMALREALEAGQNAGKLSGHEISAQRGAMRPPRRQPSPEPSDSTDLVPYEGAKGAPPPEPRPHSREAWMAGARTALADDAVAYGLQPGANVAQRTRQQLGLSGAGLEAATGDRVKQEAIEAMAGRPGVMRRLDDRLEAEDQAYATFSQLAPTIPRDEQAMRDTLKTLGTVSRAATGGWKGTMLDMLSGAQNGTFGFRRGVDERTAALMTEGAPEALRANMAALQRRGALDDRHRRRLDSLGARTARLGTSQLASLSTDPETLDEPLAVDPFGVRFPQYQFTR